MKKFYLLTMLLSLFLIHETVAQDKENSFIYSNEKAVSYIKEHGASNSKSKSMCAWYVMMAIRHAGCHFCYLYPAYAYNKILPQLGFQEVSLNHYVPRKGDISVLPKNSSSPFGHIAMYDGKNWISDFKQAGIFPGKAYAKAGKYQIFRIEDGKHYSNYHIDMNDVPEYFKSLKKGYKRIKLL